MMRRVRTTLVLDRQRLSELKRLAAREQRTLSNVMDEFLREGLARRNARKTGAARKGWPAFEMGEPTITLADRQRLLDRMDE